MRSISKEQSVLKEYGITKPQMMVLVEAAREFDSVNNKPHDGSVSLFNVRSDTSAVLFEKGYIARVPRLNGEERESHLARINALIIKAYDIARNGDMEDWQLVLQKLNFAARLQKELDDKTIRITPLGREAASNYCQEIGRNPYATTKKA